jgi:hypothetical protein
MRPWPQPTPSAPARRMRSNTEGNEFTILGPLPRDEAERIGLA